MMGFRSVEQSFGYRIGSFSKPLLNRSEQTALELLSQNPAFALLRQRSHQWRTIRRSVCEISRLQHPDIVFRIADGGYGRTPCSGVRSDEAKPGGLARPPLHDVCIGAPTDVRQPREFRGTQESFQFAGLE